MDSEIIKVLQDIPSVILKSEESILRARIRRNFRKVAAASGIALGYLMQVNKKTGDNV